tara:strand:+ start:132 stop:314 length:183 start_codon:yes stop_codon:yes gene_type:complete
MARDECNEEFRPSCRQHPDEDRAYAEMESLSQEFPEARGFWVEEMVDYRALARRRIQEEY